MRKLVSAKPFPAACEIGDVAQMGADIGPRRADEIHIRRAAAPLARHGPLINLFGDEPIGDLAEEFLAEPVHQPAHLDPAQRIVRQEPVFAKREAARFIEIFRDHIGAGDDNARFLDKKRRLPSRIENEKIAPPLEDILLDELRFNPVFPEKEPDETRMGAERMMIERYHSASGSGGGDWRDRSCRPDRLPNFSLRLR